MLRRPFATACAGFVTISLAAGQAALAGEGAGAPELTLRWWIDGELVDEVPLAGIDIGNGRWLYQGAGFDSQGRVAMSYSIIADPDPLLSFGLALENFQDEPTDVVLAVALTIDPEIPGSSLLTGSAALGLTTDSGGGSVATIDDAPLWEALVDDAQVAAFFVAPFELSHDDLRSSGVSAAFGPGAPGPAVAETISVRTSVRLTPHDQTSLTSAFNVEPSAGQANGGGPGATQEPGPIQLPAPPPPTLEGFHYPGSNGLVPRRPGDLDADGDVDVADFWTLVADWGSCPESPAPCAGDLDGNGLAGIKDLLILMSQWG